MKTEKHSGQVWAKNLNIPILDPNGWASIDDFNHKLISKEEFCNRAANSVLKTKTVATRRSAFKTLKKI